jgi:two-component system LytT family sensor kinase
MVFAAVLWLVVALCLMDAFLTAATQRRSELEDLVQQRILALNGAVAAFRDGIGTETAHRLRLLLGVPAVMIADAEGTVSWDGTVGNTHVDDAAWLAKETLATGLPRAFSPAVVSCGSPACPVLYAVTVPLKIDEETRAALVVYSAVRTSVLTRVLRAIGTWASDQLELGESERLGILGNEPPLFIVPDPIPVTFVSWSLASVKRLVRTDPERATELLRELADFLRYRSRQYGEFTELADEVRCVDQYIVLAREHLGARLAVVMDIAPEVLPLSVPFLCLQLLVERVVQYGVGPRGWRMTIVVSDSGPDVVLSLEHEDPRLPYGRLPRYFSDKPRRRPGYQGVSGLSAYTRRMRHLYGDNYALEVDVRAETSTRITVRLPKK